MLKQYLVIIPIPNAHGQFIFHCVFQGDDGFTNEAAILGGNLIT